MEVLQWLVPAITGAVAAITAIFVGMVGFLQWRTAQQKAVLDLFGNRYRIYEVVKNCVDQMSRNPGYFDNWQEKEFLKAMNEAYFFFGDDLHRYLETLRNDILIVRSELPTREQAMNRINKFYQDGQPLFAKYMRFSQTVPSTFGSRLRGWR